MGQVIEIKENIIDANGGNIFYFVLNLAASKMAVFISL